MEIVRPSAKPTLGRAQRATFIKCAWLRGSEMLTAYLTAMAQFLPVRLEDRIRKLRKEHGWTQVEFAEQVWIVFRAAADARQATNSWRDAPKNLNANGAEKGSASH